MGEGLTRGVDDGAVRARDRRMVDDNVGELAVATQQVAALRRGGGRGKTHARRQLQRRARQQLVPSPRDARGSSRRRRQ
eukprot:1151790-Prymnesium_polylepis.1